MSQRERVKDEICHVSGENYVGFISTGLWKDFGFYLNDIRS